MVNLRASLAGSLKHGIFTSSKATAYSAILTLFPALLAVTTLFAIAPDADRLRMAARVGLHELLPPETIDLVDPYFQAPRRHSITVLFSSLAVTTFASMGVMLSLIEGLHRIQELPRALWGFWHTRKIALILIPICLLPMLFATCLVAFGHPIERWMIDNADHELRRYVLFFWRLVRWSISVATSIAVMSVIYHVGTPRTRRWRKTLPGAVIATLTWFLATLGYGWYLTRFANYTVIYGSLAAVIATLVWLYITSFSILLGAEFNLHNLAAQPVTSPEIKTSPAVPLPQ